MLSTIFRVTVLTSHLDPVNPYGQTQWKEVRLLSLTHVPPSRQGLESQGRILVSQFAPSNPGAHSHRKLLTRSWQVPPFKHELQKNFKIFALHQNFNKKFLNPTIFFFTESATPLDCFPLALPTFLYSHCRWRDSWCHCSQVYRYRCRSWHSHYTPLHAHMGWRHTR